MSLLLNRGVGVGRGEGNNVHAKIEHAWIVWCAYGGGVGVGWGGGITLMLKLNTHGLYGVHMGVGWG